MPIPKDVPTELARLINMLVAIEPKERPSLRQTQAELLRLHFLFEEKNEKARYLQPVWGIPTRPVAEFAAVAPVRTSAGSPPSASPDVAAASLTSDDATVFVDGPQVVGTGTQPSFGTKQTQPSHGNDEGFSDADFFSCEPDSVSATDEPGPHIETLNGDSRDVTYVCASELEQELPHAVRAPVDTSEVPLGDQRSSTGQDITRASAQVDDHLQIPAEPSTPELVPDPDPDRELKPEPEPVGEVQNTVIATPKRVEEVTQPESDVYQPSGSDAADCASVQEVVMPARATARTPAPLSLIHI